MPTVAVTHRKRYEDVINGPFSLYVRETAVGGVLVDLGHTGHEIWISIRKVAERIDRLQEHPFRTRIEIKAQLYQSSSEILATLESMRGKLCDVLFFEDTLSSKNFYFRNMNIAVDGEAPQTFDKASVLPITITGYVKSYNDLYKRSTQENSINLLTQYQPEQALVLPTSFPEFSTADLDDGFGGTDNGLANYRLNNEFTYYDPPAGLAPQGFTAYGQNFDLKFKHVFQMNEVNAGGKIGVCIVSRNGGDIDGSVAYVLSFYCDASPVNYKTRLYFDYVNRVDEEWSAISNNHLPPLTLGTTPYEFRLSLREQELTFYMDDQLLISHTVEADDDGYYFGLFRTDVGGSVPATLNHLYDVRYKTEIIN